MQVGHTTTLLDTIGQLQGYDVVLIFGKTRAGKSTFINDAYRTRILESKTSMLSDTHTISFVEPPLQVDDSKVYLIDTIGLGGSEALENRMMLASRWTCIFCPDLDLTSHKDGPLHPTVKGFFYFIDITDAAGLNDDNQLNLDFFKRLVGTETLESVVFVTTKWASPTDRARRVQETRFREWEKRINDQFSGAKLIRLDDSTSRWSDEELAEMPTEEAEEEKTRYYENSMTALRLLLKKPATSATSLEIEIKAARGAGTMRDIGIMSLAIEEARAKAESLDKLGRQAEAAYIRGSADRLAAVKVSDAMDRYKVYLQRRNIESLDNGATRMVVEEASSSSRTGSIALPPVMPMNSPTEGYVDSLRRGKETGREVTGNEPIGGALGTACVVVGKGCMDSLSLISNPTQQRALEDAYNDRMVPRWEKMTKYCAQTGATLGPKGRLCGGTFGAVMAMGFNAVDTVRIWSDNICDSHEQRHGFL